MPDFYNVIQAASYIGCDPKTVRRMLKREQLTAERTSRGWLAIPAWQVEQARINWQMEQARFDAPNERIDSIGLHEDIIVRVETLERKVAQLEAMLSNASLPITTSPYTESLQSQKKPLNYAVDKSDVQPPQSTQKRATIASSTIPSDLPEGTLHSTEFGARLGFTKPQFEGMLKNGVRGEQLEREKIPTAREGSYANYFTPSQQEQAIALLRRHGKIQ